MSPFDPHWEEPSPAPQGSAFCDAVLAASLLAIDPVGLGGILVRAWSGPARDGFLARLYKLTDRSVNKLPLGVTDEVLLGGLDIGATLQAGFPVQAVGLLPRAAGNFLVLAMAERIFAPTAARICAFVDRGVGFSMIALDEGIEPDETPPAALQDRMAFTLHTLPALTATWPGTTEISQAKQSLAVIKTSETDLRDLCTIAVMLGIDSLRAPLFALRAARAAAALHGRDAVAPADIAIAARLVLAPRATRAPADAEQPEESPQNQDSTEQQTPETLEDSIATAAKSTLPPELLAALTAAGPRRMTRGAGKSGQTFSPKRGRPAGTRRGAPGGGARLSLIETLRAAAPWQPIRRTGNGRKIVVKRDDFRVKKFKEQARTVAIFAVDASGSSAVNRLAEAKGAIQLLLAECYVRRDQVALIAFRGRAAEILLPPTSALARARRALAALPGGGPTPLATGLQAARVLAETERRGGKLPLLVILTDGGANIGRDGNPGRASAAADALAAGKLCRGLASLVVDTAPRPQAFVKKLAADMGGRYLALPYADTARLAAAVQQAGRG